MLSLLAPCDLIGAVDYFYGILFFRRSAASQAPGFPAVRTLRLPQGAPCGKTGRLRGSAPAEKEDVLKVTHGLDQVTRRQKGQHGRSEDREPPGTMQCSGWRARPAARGSASADGATQMAKETPAAFPDVRGAVHGNEPPRGGPPIQRERN